MNLHAEYGGYVGRKRTTETEHERESQKIEDISSPLLIGMTGMFSYSVPFKVSLF